MRSIFPIIVVALLFLTSSDKSFSSILPLATTNQWVYEFDNRSPALLSPPSNPSVAMELGDIENLGDICIRPLMFGDGQLSLYLGNQNEVVVLYGFQGIINERNIEFFFYDNDKLSVYSGVVLSGLEDDILLKEQKGKQKRLLNEQEVTLEWEVRNKNISIEPLSQSYIGAVNEAPSTINSGELYTLEFYLFIGPCPLEGGCNAGIFTFTFLPNVGVTEIHLRGDHPEFGGQFDHIYTLLTDPQESFDITSVDNQVDNLSCQFQDKNKQKKSGLGNTPNWFNIFLLIVIVLRGFNVFSYSFLRVYSINKY